MSGSTVPASFAHCDVVLFDYEGTLATLAPPHAELDAAYAAILALLPDDGTHDLHSPHEIAKLHTEIFTAVAAARDARPDEEANVLGTYLEHYASHGVSCTKELIHRIYLLEQHAWGHGAVPVEGALTTLAALHDRGYAIGLASNASYPEAVMLQLAQLGMLPYLESISLSGLTKIRKPDPSVFTALAATLGSAPERCIMVGDKVHEDMGGARNAGMQGILYLPIGSSLTPPDTIPAISDIRSLLEILPEGAPS